MAYSGQAEQVFQDALVSAFPTYESMEQLVRLLDVNLAEISRRGNLRDVVFDVVRWADRENRVPDLVRTAAGEQPANPRLQQALRHVEDPLLVEDRWFAKHVPVLTWLLGAANVALLLLVAKVYFANLINTFGLLRTLAFTCVVAAPAWRLYAWLFAKPVRARIGTLLRRLVAHSRLERRDWLAFGGLLSAVIVQATAILAAPAPLNLSLERRATDRFWKGTEFVLVGSFPNLPSEMEAQGPTRAGLRDRDRFSESYYRADFFIGRRNVPRQVKLQIDLLPPASGTPDPDKVSGPPGVTFVDVAVDRTLGAVLLGQGTRIPVERGRISETSIEFIVALDEIIGRRTILFTCQRQLDGQPTPTKVTVYARILDAKSGAPLFPAEEAFPIDDWRRPEILAGGADPGVRR